VKLGSLFAGVGGFDKGFEDAGFETVWQVEKEPFCIAVLKTRFPNAERYYEIKDCGGMDGTKKHKLKYVDIITGGAPCQDVSVAGKRAGLAGERTGLFYEFARILKEVRPAWFVFENVPGLLSSNRGRDFAEVLRVLMVECGYGVCWRVLDSQFFGVAQRRRRVFIAGRFGKPCPAEVLFEPEGDVKAAPQKSIFGCIAGGYGTKRCFDRTFTAIEISDSNGDGEVAGLPLGLDSARYRALGNACTVQVCNWIAKRIKEVSQTEHPSQWGTHY